MKMTTERSRRTRSCASSAVAIALMCLAQFTGCDRPTAPPAPAAAGSETKPDTAISTAAASANLPTQYAAVKALDSGMDELHGIAVDAKDSVYLAGAPGVRVIDAEGKPLRDWATPGVARCITVGGGGTVYVGETAKIHTYSPQGKLLKSWGDEGGGPGQLKTVTAIVVAKPYLLVADAGNRCVHRFDLDGELVSDFGRRDPEANYPGLICPSPYLDCDVDAAGKLYVTNPGMQRVETFASDGALLGFWGKPSALLSRPDGFFGCCNPSSLALLADGSVVTGEKLAARVKVYSPKGELLAFIGSGHFTSRVTGLDLAVDSQGRIWVADSGDRKVKVFAKMP